MGLFDFLKKDKGPRPIFAALGTDMHCHLIPRVDDGSKSMDETLICLKMMQEVGYKRVYITPHFQTPRFPNTEDDIKARFAEVKEAVAKAELKIELAGIGGEYRLDIGFFESFRERQMLSIGGVTALDKGYLLVELSMSQFTPHVDEVIGELQGMGYNVILAHPERYPYLNDNSSFLETLKDMGVMLQINVLSLDGFYGSVPMHKGYELIKRGWVELMDTDTHNVFYGQALVNASHNKRIEKLLEKNSFLNIEL